VNRNNLILFRNVWTYSYEIVSFGLFELNVSDIILELEVKSQTFLVLLTRHLVEVPLGLISFRLVNQLFSNLLKSFGKFPNHKFDCLSMTKSNDVVCSPMYGEN